MRPIVLLSLFVIPLLAACAGDGAQTAATQTAPKAATQEQARGTTIPSVASPGAPASQPEVKLASPTAARVASPVASPSPGITATRVITFEVSQANVTRTESGSCFASSAAATRDDAWRCNAENAILDPCFGEANADAVTCVEDPLSGAAVRLNLTQPLPEAGAPQEPRPWYLELADGTRCSFATGATEAVNGDRLNYSCTDQSWVVGDPNEQGQVWTVRTVSPPLPPPGSTTPTPTRTVQVKTAWF